MRTGQSLLLNLSGAFPTVILSLRLLPTTLIIFPAFLALHYTIYLLHIFDYYLVLLFCWHFNSLGSLSLGHCQDNFCLLCPFGPIILLHFGTSIFAVHLHFHRHSHSEYFINPSWTHINIKPSIAIQVTLPALFDISLSSAIVSVCGVQLTDTCPSFRFQFAVPSFYPSFLTQYDSFRNYGDALSHLSHQTFVVPSLGAIVSSNSGRMTPISMVPCSIAQLQCF